MNSKYNFFPFLFNYFLIQRYLKHLFFACTKYHTLQQNALIYYKCKKGLVFCRTKKTFCCAVIPIFCAFLRVLIKDGAPHKKNYSGAVLISSRLFSSRKNSILIQQGSEFVNETVPYRTLLYFVYRNVPSFNKSEIVTISFYE